MSNSKVCSLDEAFNLLGLCYEDRLYDFEGSYQALHEWLGENHYTLKGQQIYKISLNKLAQAKEQQ